MVIPQRGLAILALLVALAGAVWAQVSSELSALSTTTGSAPVEARWDGAPLDSVLFALASRAGREVILTDSVRGLVHLEARSAPAGELFDQLALAHRLRVTDHQGVLVVRGPAPASTVALAPMAFRTKLTAPVSLLLEAIDVQRLVALIAEEHNLTIICAPSVRGRLWIRVIERRLMQVLEILAAALETPLVVTPHVMRLGPETLPSKGK